MKKSSVPATSSISIRINTISIGETGRGSFGGDGFGGMGLVAVSVGACVGASASWRNTASCEDTRRHPDGHNDRLKFFPGESSLKARIYI